jgi:hypothetical protein
LVALNGLTRLSESVGVGFPALVAARRGTEGLLEERRTNLADLGIDPDAAIVLMGSWGRLEATQGSDDDFMLLIDGPSRDESEVQPTIEETWKALGRSGKKPGAEDVFGVPAFSDALRTIGLEEDGNKNLTRRMLLLLESRSVLGDDVFKKVKSEVLHSYLKELTADKDFHPPRFLLNDVFRYWRTIAVDFEAKHRDRDGLEWGLRNAKLRTSRPLLFASALLPVLECRRLAAHEMEPFLSEQFDATPLDRVAACFLRHERADSGARAMAAYDAFLTMLESERDRCGLERLSYESRGSSTVFSEAKRHGEDIREALLSLLFETRDLYELVREYAIF